MGSRVALPGRYIARRKEEEKAAHARTEGDATVKSLSAQVMHGPFSVCAPASNGTSTAARDAPACSSPRIDHLVLTECLEVLVPQRESQKPVLIVGIPVERGSVHRPVAGRESTNVGTQHHHFARNHLGCLIRRGTGGTPPGMTALCAGRGVAPR